MTLAIFANYPRHFLRITLAICVNYPRHPHYCDLNYPRLYIELPSPFDLFSKRDYRITRPRILTIMYSHLWWHYC